MKILIFIFVFVCSVAFTMHAMETNTEINNMFRMLPLEIREQIFALSDLDTQAKIYGSCPNSLIPINLPDKDKFKYFVPFLPQSLHALSKKWLLSLMIHVARKKDRITFKKFMRHIAAGGHDDILDAMKYFFTKESKQYAQFCEYSVMKDNAALELSLLDMMSGYQDCKKCVDALLASALGKGKVKPILMPDDEKAEWYKSFSLHRLILSKQNNTLIKIFLLQHPVLLNTKSDTLGNTPLCLAIQKKNLELCKFLLSFEDIDLSIANNKGTTPWLWAMFRGKKAILELLLNYIVERRLEEKCLKCLGACKEKPCCHIIELINMAK